MAISTSRFGLASAAFSKRCYQALQRRAAAAWGVLVLHRVEFGLKRGNLIEVCQTLGVTPPDLRGAGSKTATQLSVEQRRRALALTRRSLRWSGLPNTCLRQCLLFGYLTRQARPALYVGVRRGSQPFEAHAWLQYPDGSLWDPAAGAEVSQKPEALESIQALRSFSADKLPKAGERSH